MVNGILILVILVSVYILVTKNTSFKIGYLTLLAL